MREDGVMQVKKFSEIDITDSFFDTLKSSYAEFSDWFARKANEVAYTVYDGTGHLQGFLYIKGENGPIRDVTPPINASRVLKVGTFKINAHRTKLGERFVKKIFDYAIEWKVSHIYVTVFEEHIGLISLLQNYGFKRYGVKNTTNGAELVFLKDFNTLTGNIVFDYPIINASSNKWVLSVKPEYHTNLFPDSILRTEDSKIISDISHTNSIHKVYIGRALDMPQIRVGDTLIIYRPGENGPKWFHSVVTSLCVVEDIRPRSNFESERDFLDYAAMHSIFDEQDLLYWLHRPDPEMHAIKMTYNVALPKRPNLKALVEQAGLDREAYWGLHQIGDEQFANILKLGNVYEGVVIH